MLPFRRHYWAILLAIGSMSSPLAAQDVEPLPTWSVPGAPGGKLAARPVALAKGSLTLEDKTGKQHAVKLADLPDAEQKDALITVVGSGVVVVQTKDVLQNPFGMGSGFVVDAAGLVLTNYHVVRGAGLIEVSLRDGKTVLPAELVAINRANDVAVLKVAKLPAGTHVLELATAERPRARQSVWTIGHPKGFKDTVSSGEVGAVRKTAELPDPLPRMLRAPEGTLWIQTDAVIDRGSSGGPLLNPAGHAIGMNTFVAGRGLGFALFLAHAADPLKTAAAAKPMTLPLAPADGELALQWWSREVGPLYGAFEKEFYQLNAQVAGQKREQVLSRVQALNKKHRPAMLGVARQDPAGWPAFQALYYALDMSNDGSDDAAKDLDETLRSLGKHHLMRMDMAAVAVKAGSLPLGVGRDFLDRVLAGSPHRDVQAQAAYSLSQNRLAWLTYDASLDLTEVKAARTQIEGLANRLNRDFPEVGVLVATNAGQQLATGQQAADLTRAQLALVHVGLPARETAGIDAAGTTFKLSEYKGKVILLDFFANWCPWCVKSYPAHQKLVKDLKDKPFALLGVNADNEKVLSELVQGEKPKVTWRSWADGEAGPIHADWGVNSWPTLFLIDKDGIVRRQFSGEPTAEQLKTSIDKLLGEAKK
jgi:thiol-disulfide isomerase/thioredoxin